MAADDTTLTTPVRDGRAADAIYAVVLLGAVPSIANGLLVFAPLERRVLRARGLTAALSH